MKILILGSSGLLGNYLYNFLQKNFQVFNNGLRKRKINLLNTSELKIFLLKIKPDIIINCTANTNLDNCENKKKDAYNTNYKTLQNIVNLNKQNNIKSKIIQISTDQFYNNKNHKLNKESVNWIPNYYCKTKYLVERFCIKNKIVVLRTNFFGKSNSKNKSFSDWIFDSFKSQKMFNLFHDVYFSPLNLNTLSRMIEKVIINIKDINGIYNIGSSDCISKKEFAIKFAKSCKIYKKNYHSISSSGIFVTKRPNFMCMNIKKFEKKFKIKMPSIQSQISQDAKNYKLKK